MADEDEYYTIDLSAKLERNDDFMKALGDITYNSAWLEGALISVLADMNNGSAAYAILAEMSFHTSLNSARALIHEIAVDGWAKKFFLGALGRAQTAYDYRNRVVHSMWFGIEGSSTEFVALRHRVKGKVVRHEHVVSLAELREIADDIANAAARIARITNYKAFTERRMFVKCHNCGHQH